MSAISRIPLSPARKSLAVGFFTLLVILLPMISCFDVPGIGMDEGVLLVYPELLLHGKIPYRDFETYYGPGNVLTLAGVYAVFGTHVDVERTVGLLYRLAVLAGIFLVARRVSLIAAVAGTLMGCALVIPVAPSAFAWYGGVACALGALLWIAREASGKWRAPVGGVLAGVALLFRIDLAPAMVFSAAPLVLLLPARERLRFIAALVLGLLPLGVILLMSGLRATLENLFIYPVIIGNPARHLPLSSVPRDVLILFGLHLIAAVTNIAVGFLLCRKDRSSWNARLFLATALLGAGLTHQAFQRMDSLHTLFAVVLSISLLPSSLAALAALVRRKDAETSPFVGVAVSCAAIAVLCWTTPSLPPIVANRIASAFETRESRSRAVTVRDRSFLLRFIGLEAQETVSYLERNSAPGQRLFVGPGDMRFAISNDSFIYHLLPWLTPATYFIEMNPLSANRPGSRLANDVASADWVVLNHSWDQPSEDNLSSVPGSDAPNEIVRTQFTLCGRAYPYEVYRRGSRAAQ